MTLCVEKVLMQRPDGALIKTQHASLAVHFHFRVTQKSKSDAKRKEYYYRLKTTHITCHHLNGLFPLCSTIKFLFAL
jgi:hypothetical protein